MCLKHQEKSSVDIKDRQRSVRMVPLLPGDHLENLPPSTHPPALEAVVCDFLGNEANPAGICYVLT